jgi:hypothetical protein
MVERKCCVHDNCGTEWESIEGCNHDYPTECDQCDAFNDYCAQIEAQDYVTCQKDDD